MQSIAMKPLQMSSATQTVGIHFVFERICLNLRGTFFQASLSGRKKTTSCGWQTYVELKTKNANFKLFFRHDCITCGVKCELRLSPN